MPFGFRRGKGDSPTTSEPAPTDQQEPPGIPFDALTEDWRLVGRMLVEGRLSDALNRREPIDIVDVGWAPIDRAEEVVEAPGLRQVDPYDLVIVLGGYRSLPTMSEEERTAHRVHKVAYYLGLEAPPFRVHGTVFLYPGIEPERLLDRAPEMFIPVVDATASMGGTQIGESDTDIILVNRAYLRGVTSVDSTTGRDISRLPGSAPALRDGDA